MRRRQEANLTRQEMRGELSADQAWRVRRDGDLRPSDHDPLYAAGSLLCDHPITNPGSLFGNTSLHKFYTSKLHHILVLSLAIEVNDFLHRTMDFALCLDFIFMERCIGLNSF